MGLKVKKLGHAAVLQGWVLKGVIAVWHPKGIFHQLKLGVLSWYLLSIEELRAFALPMKPPPDLKEQRQSEVKYIYLFKILASDHNNCKRISAALGA